MRIYVAACLLYALPLLATTHYVTENGSQSGSCTTGVHDIDWLNNARNWGNRSGQINPGDTVLLCGSFTGNAGATKLNVPGSGSLGSPVTLQFDTNATFEAPYWGKWTGAACTRTACGAAIVVDGQHDITIDGASSGVIENTQNGTGLEHQSGSIGLWIMNAANVEVKNLTIRSIYVKRGTTDNNGRLNNADIRVEGTCPNLNIHNNTLTGSSIGVSWSVNGVNTQLAYNHISDHCWAVGAAGTNNSGSPWFHHNEISDWNNWYLPSSACHTDGIFNRGESAATYTPVIDSNYIHGDLAPTPGGSPTGFIFCTNSGSSDGSGSACMIRNNVLVGEGRMVDNMTLIFFNPAVGTSQMGPHFIYNNTLVYSGHSIYMSGADSSTKYTVMNNIFIGGKGDSTFFISQGGQNAISNFTIDNNVYYHGRLRGYLNVGRSGEGLGTYSLPQWTGRSGPCLSNGGTGCDMHGSTTRDPRVGANYFLQKGSAAIGMGADLSSIFSVDKAGQTRTVPWDAGAYAYQTSAQPSPINTAFSH